MAKNVAIEMLDEDFVKLWSQNPDIFKKGIFLKMVGRYLHRFVKPPNEIVQ